MTARPEFVPANPDFAASVRRKVLGMPVAGLFGVDLSDLTPGYAEAVLPYRDDLSYLDGHFQGTVVAAVAYFAATSSIATLLPDQRIAMTLDQNVKFLAPAVGRRLVARGRVVTLGRSVSVAAADVFAEREGSEILCATVLVTTRNVDRAR